MSVMCPLLTYTLLNTLTLQRTLPLIRIVLKHNFVSGLLVVAGCVMSLHYCVVISLNSGCPMIIATGESETGKSTAIKVAIFLTGTSGYYVVKISPAGVKNSIYVKGSNAFFLERAALSSLPLLSMILPGPAK